MHRISLFILPVLLVLSGCMSTSVNLKATDDKNVSVLPFNAKFTFSSFGKVPKELCMPQNVQELEKQWNEVVSNDLIKNHPGSPSYQFDIKILCLNVIFWKPPMSITNHNKGIVLLQLNVFNDAGNLIHERKFKTIGEWVSSGLGFIGPVDIGAGLGIHDATVKLGLLDIYKYIYSSKFLADSPSHLVREVHKDISVTFENMPPNQVFKEKEMKPEDEGKRILIYYEGLPQAAYVDFLMAESIDSLEKFYPGLWTTEWHEWVPYVAKLAYKFEWPFFPMKITEDMLPKTGFANEEN